MLDKEILVVDDEKDLRTMIRSIFVSAGYTQVRTAVSGEEALEHPQGLPVTAVKKAVR